jgi:hypothetical protein
VAFLRVLKMDNFKSFDFYLDAWKYARAHQLDPARIWRFSWKQWRVNL